MKKLLLLAVPFTVFLSCSSDSEDTTPVKAKKIIEVKQDNQPFYKFTYNSKGAIEQITNYNNGVPANITVVEYTNDLETKRRVYNSQYTLFNYQTYTYTGKFISERSIFSVNQSTGQEILTQVTRYTNDATKSSNNLTAVQYYDGTGNLKWQQEISYTDKNGSSITNVYSDSGVKTNVSTTVKDNSIAWDKVLDPFVYQHDHNTTSSDNKNLVDGSTTGYTVEFTYDKDNYPLTAKYVHSNGLKYTYTFTWE